jgi:hypothetical protein
MGVCLACLGQIHELLHIQQLVSQAAEKRFRKSILPRRARLDVKHLQASRRRMLADRRGNELRTVVAANVFRHAASQKQVRQNIQHTIGRDPAIHLQRQALARVLVRDREPLQRLACHGAVVDEVPRPNVVLVLRATTDTTVAAVTQTTLFTRLLRHFQPFATPKSVNPFEVHLPTFLTKFRRDEAITVTRMHANQLVDPRDQSLFFFRIRLRLVTLRAARLTKHCTCPTLRHLLFLLDVLDRLSTPRRA